VDRIVAWYRVTSSVGAVVALIVANLIPLVGVLFFSWNVWMILIVYWLENGVVGVFNILKMLKAEGGPGDASAGLRMNGRPVNDVAKAGLVPFFVVHYGIFWAVHGVFVFTLPVFGSMETDAVDMTSGFEPLTIPFAVLALTISHGLSYWFNFIKGGEYQRVSAAQQMFAPYGRLVVLHITIIIGGMAIAFLGAPAAVVAILVALKTALDVGFHLAEHRKVEAPAGATVTPG
jgi:energy-coupling factor transporter transmembrane protein EcfT